MKTMKTVKEQALKLKGTPVTDIKAEVTSEIIGYAVPESKSPFINVIENIPFWNFKKSPKFTGIYQHTQEIGEKEFFFVNIFSQIETGQKFCLIDSFLIHRAIHKARTAFEEAFVLKEVVFEIEFFGKINIDGKTFNKFSISYTTLDSYNKFYNKKFSSDK